MFPTFSAPQPEGTPKSDAAKGQKISSGEVLALGGGALAGCAVVFTVVGIHSLGVGTRYTAAPDSCHDPPLECWDGFSRANSGTMCPVMNQDTFIRGELFKAGMQISILVHCCVWIAYIDQGNVAEALGSRIV